MWESGHAGAAAHCLVDGVDSLDALDGQLFAALAAGETGLDLRNAMLEARSAGPEVGAVGGGWCSRLLFGHCVARGVHCWTDEESR